MKIFSIILLAVVIVSQSEGADLNEKLKTFLESLKEVLKNGDPPLDPFEWKNIPGPNNISFTEDLVGTIDADSLKISNYSDYDVKHAAFSLVGLKIEASFSWPDFIYGKVNGYDINCRFMDFVNIFGKGDANFTIQDFKFDVKTAITMDPKTKKLALKSLNIEFSLGGFRIDMDGLYDDEMMSEVISHVISDMAIEVFNTYYPNLKPLVEKLISDLANKYLGEMTMSDLLELINGGKSVNAFLH